MTEYKLKSNYICNSKSMEGMTIKVDNLIDNQNFIKKSKELAQTYEWLYHITSASALKSILKNKEFWLSNLKLVNDKEEVQRIDVPKYEKTYYLSCFSYASDVSEDNWIEYGKGKESVLIGVKQKWFKRNVAFMCGDNQKIMDDFLDIKKNQKCALQYKIEQQKQSKRTNPFYINAFGFYQVIYNDELKKNIQGKSEIEIDGVRITGCSLSPEIAGIVKSTHGICCRNGKEEYDKDWTTEKEVRLKVGIQQFDISMNGNEEHDKMIMQDAFFPKIAVSLTEDAFSVIRIKFSPKFENKDAFMNELRELMPHSKLEII